MGQLAAAIETLFATQRRYEDACARQAPIEELVVIVEDLHRAIIAHGEALLATPRAQWQAEADMVIRIQS